MTRNHGYVNWLSMLALMVLKKRKQEFSVKKTLKTVDQQLTDQAIYPVSLSYGPDIRKTRLSYGPGFRPTNHAVEQSINVPPPAKIVFYELPLYIICLSMPSLVAQSSATGVTAAETPPCSAIRFRNPKVTLHQPDATPPLGPCLLQMRGECDRRVRRKVRHLDLEGCSAILARHL